VPLGVTRAIKMDELPGVEQSDLCLCIECNICYNEIPVIKLTHICSMCKNFTICNPCFTKYINTRHTYKYGIWIPRIKCPQCRAENGFSYRNYDILLDPISRKYRGQYLPDAISRRLLDPGDFVLPRREQYPPSGDIPELETSDDDIWELEVTVDDDVPELEVTTHDGQED
jgi:hypothetical protein